jgi:hypothetical protein
LLWYDAQYATSFKPSTGAVRLWADRSGNNQNLAQATAAARPTRVDAALGGQAVVRFSGEQMLGGPDLTGPTGYEIFVVWQSPILPPTTFSVLFTNGVRDDPNLQLIHGHSVSGYGNSALSYFEDYLALAFEPAVVDTPTLWNAAYGTGSGMAIFTNGAQTDSDPVDLPLPDPEEPITVGGFDDDYFFEGDIGEVILFSRALNGTERTSVNAYLEARWGFDVTP